MRRIQRKRYFFTGFSDVKKRNTFYIIDIIESSEEEISLMISFPFNHRKYLLCISFQMENYIQQTITHIMIESLIKVFKKDIS